MLPPELIALSAIGAMECCLALILNISIVYEDSKCWRKGQQGNHSDLIHLIIGLVNIVLQCLLLEQGTLAINFVPLMFMCEVYSSTIFLTNFLIYYSYWLSAWLCVHYCTSITNFTHPVFVWLKKKFSVYLPHLLLLSLVMSFIISVPSIWTVTTNVVRQSLGNSSHDSTIISGVFTFPALYIQTANFLGCCVPFILTSLSVVTTTSSLLGHIWKMKQNISCFDGSKLWAHIRAIWTMVLFLTLFIIFYTGVSLFFTVDPGVKDPVTVIGWLIFMSFPLAESIIIIQASAKLRKMFLRTILVGI